MPTVFTHAAVGGALAQFAPAGPSKWKLAATLAVLAVAPDLDIFAFTLGIPYSHPLGHRGFSHSLVFALALSLTVFFVFVRPRLQTARQRWACAALAFVAVASHGFLDAATDAGRGIGFLIPISNTRFFLPFRPIRTAAINPLEFFSRDTLEVFWSEALWVWLPLISGTVVWQAVRWRRRKTDGSSLERS